MTRRVLIFSHEHGALNGPNVWLTRIAPRLRQAGWDVRVAFVCRRRKPSQILRILEKQEVPVLLVDRFPDDLRAEEAAVQACIETQNPAIVVGNFVRSALACAAWCRQRGIRTVACLRSDDAYYHELRRTFVAGEAESRVDAVVCVSEDLERAVREDNPHGLPVARIPSGTPIPKERARWHESPFRIVYAGRIIQKQKCILDLTRFLIERCIEDPRLEAVLYGEGPEETAVSRLVAEAGLQERIRLAGRISPTRMQAEYLQAQGFLLMSAYEGLSMAMQEAMACGLPVINGAGAGGLRMEACFDADAWQRTSKEARQAARNRFSIDRATRDWSTVLDGVVSGNGR